MKPSLPFPDIPSIMHPEAIKPPKPPTMYAILSQLNPDIDLTQLNPNFPGISSIKMHPESMNLRPHPQSVHDEVKIVTVICLCM